jgi:hypothetical protein
MMTNGKKKYKSMATFFFCVVLGIQTQGFPHAEEVYCP